jgi:F0F1-type ATP synthase assembly protein I
MMDIGISSIVPIIIGSTTDYISTYSPVFLLISGIVLALAVIGGIIDKFFGSRDDDKKE